MRVAEAKGKLRGKLPKLNPRQEAHLADLFRQGEHSTAELADLFGVARVCGGNAALAYAIVAARTRWGGVFYGLREVLIDVLVPPSVEAEPRERAVLSPPLSPAVPTGLRLHEETGVDVGQDSGITVAPMMVARASVA